MLMAAALPIALAVGALGSWGFQHKQRADALATAVAQQEQQLRNMKVSAEPQTNRSQPAPMEVSAPVIAQNTMTRGKVKTIHPNGELVLEVKSYQAPTLDTQPVKGQ
jgi:hypothetical protein